MAESTTVLVEAKSVRRSFQLGGQAVEALLPASFRIYAGDRVALVGRSGSGKTTLLHLMAGLDTPSSGRMSWPALGPAADLLPHKIAMVFQVPSLLEPLTVAENIALPLRLAMRAGVGEPEGTDEKVRCALAIFKLESLASKLPEQLSGGQMQRVAMARATVTKPQLILADEPTGQLDHASADALLDALLAHLAGTDTALVIATHDPSVAARMTDIWPLTRGRLTPGEREAEA